MSKIKIAVLASVLLLVVIAGYLWQAGFLSPGVENPPGPPEKITIGTTLDAKSALLFIAQHKGYFSNNGLDLTLKTFPSGKIACQQLLAGNIDVANFADFVLVDQIFAGSKSLRCLGAIAAAGDHYVLVLKDRDILEPRDLRGKRIGAPYGTTAEFFWGRFLAFNDLRLKEVELVNISPPDLEDALVTGRVEAVMVWEQWAEGIRKRLGDKIISWPGQSGQKYYWLLGSTNEFIKSRPEALIRLFRALAQAETFIKEHRDESLAIIAQQLNLDQAGFKTYWLNNEYELSFDQGLVITMEDQARWMIQNKLTDRTTAPNFLNYFTVEPLAKADPKAVRVIIPKAERGVAPGPTGTGPERP